MADAVLLGLDIASDLGWAVAVCDGKESKIKASGIYALNSAGLFSHAQRLHRFRTFLCKVASKGCDEIVMERPLFFSGDKSNPRRPEAFMLPYKYLGVLEEFCCERGIKLSDIHPSTLKKGFTGNGRAEKAEMCARCSELGWQHGEEGSARNHDEADACALLFVTLWERGHNVTFGE